MLRKNIVTVCADLDYWEDVKCVLGEIRDSSDYESYFEDRKFYASFKTRLNTKKVAKKFEETLYKTRTEIHGTVIFLKVEG